MSMRRHFTRIMGFLYVDSEFKSEDEVRKELSAGLSLFTDPEDSIDLYVIERWGFNTSIRFGENLFEFNSNKYVLLFGNIYEVTPEQLTADWNSFVDYTRKHVRIIDMSISIKDTT